MRAHREGGENDVVALFRPDRHHDDLGGVAGFGQLHGGFDGVLVEGVHRHANVLGLDPRTIGTDADAHRVIDDALDGNEDFHRFLRICRVFGKYDGGGQVQAGKF